MDTTTKKFAFVLGREQEICLEELKSVLCRFCFSFDIYRISGNVVFANIDNLSNDDISNLINALAGTIKIYELAGSLGNDISQQLADLILERKSGTSGKINFGVSCFNKNLSLQQINSFALAAKKKLKGKFSLRYVESKDGAELSSILTLKNNLLNKGIEIGIFDEEVGILVALNNPEEWNKRDYGKPASDKFSGMLPPKLARMMVNLALGEIGLQSAVGSRQENRKLQTANCILIDPFCGSGNILMEAMMVGCNVIGSDISEKAVQDSIKNVQWLTNEYQLSGIESRVFQADATKYDFKQLAISNKQLAVAGEPYLGEPKKFKQSYNAARGEYDKVREIYLAFLKNIASLSSSGLTRGSSLDSRRSLPRTPIQGGNDSSIVICLVFPLVETIDQGQFSLYKECVDEIKKMGYTQTRTPLVYGRDYQVVKREIVLLKIEQK